MTTKEVETLAELVAIKTTEAMKECILDITKEMIADKVALHSAQCKVGRLTAAKTGLIMLLTSSVTLFGRWFLSKL